MILTPNMIARIKVQAQVPRDTLISILSVSVPNKSESYAVFDVVADGSSRLQRIGIRLTND